MKPLTCLIVILAVITAGCTASNKTAANRPHSLVAPNPTAMPADLAGDDEFDLIEGELDEQEVKISDPLRPLNRAMFNFNDKETPTELMDELERFIVYWLGPRGDGYGEPL